MQNQQTPSVALAVPSPPSCSKITGKRPDIPPDAAERILRDAAERSRQLAAENRQKAVQGNLPVAQVVRKLSSAVVSDAAVLAYERAQRIAEAAERVRNCEAGARVPERYKLARLDQQSAVPNDADSRYAAACAKLSQMLTRPGLYALCGPLGTGKTHMACALVNEFCELGRSARYVKTGDYIRDYRSTWDKGEAGAESRFEADHVHLSLLVLDEWQVRRDTSDENTILLRLLDKRYDAERTTLLISNHESEDDFSRSIDARVASRICDGGGFILCDWEDLRGRIERRENVQ